MLNEIEIYFSNPITKKFLLSVFIFYCMDFITGITKAWKNKNFSSNKMRNSVDKAVKYASLICIGIIADLLFSLDFGCITVCLYLCSIELSSLKENYKESNLKIPEAITSLFNKNNDNNDDNDKIQYELEDYQL